MRCNTALFIELLIANINTAKEGFECFYERADKSAAFPYGVASGINVTSLDDGYLVSFDLDLWTDDKLPTATEEIEELCDLLHNHLHNRIISRDGELYAHIGYEGRDTSDDRDTDISHRRMFFAARIFYVN